MPIKPIVRKRKFLKITRAENVQLKQMLENYGKDVEVKKPEAPVNDMWSFGPHMIPDFSHATDAFEHVVDGFKPKKPAYSEN